ncbi:MAG: winged helix-turn-helix domain-containing protein, partial [Promethearchaeota archaeon]
NSKSDFEFLLHTISSPVTYDILRLYSKRNYNLTETAKNLNLSISTVQDNLKKLEKSELIYSNKKKYQLSGFGKFILLELEKINKFNKLNQFLGKIPADLIPPQFLNELAKNVSNIHIGTSSMTFMSYMNDIIKDLKNAIVNGYHEFKVIGWWSLKMDIDFFKTFFKGFELNIPTFEKISKHFKFELITNETVLNEILNDKNFNELINHFQAYESIQISEKLKNCNITIIGYEKLVVFLLVENNDFNLSNFLFIEDNDNCLQFFENLFNYYLKSSKSIESFIK